MYNFTYNYTVTVHIRTYTHYSTSTRTINGLCVHSKRFRCWWQNLCVLLLRQAWPHLSRVSRDVPVRVQLTPVCEPLFSAHVIL